MAAIDNLFARVRYPSGETNLPIVMLLHGWSSDADIFTEAQLTGLAAQSLLVCVVAMRGRNGADGSKDADGKEIYDIYDALQYAKIKYADIVSADKAAIVGFSGGGGNALAAACKFPDAFSLVVSHFGMSDLGRNNPDGWYYNNGSGAYTAGIVAQVGGTPASVPNNYYARDATAAIQNYTGGKLLLFHDAGDSLVPIVHSERIVTAMDNASLTNYTAYLTDAGDSPRWSHNNYVVGSEAIWVPLAKSQAAWTVPASGTATVIGYIKTKLFELRLGALNNHAATVVYGAEADTYTVTPLTGEVEVTIIQADGKTIVQTINAETELVVV